MSTPADIVCKNCSDLDLHGIFRGDFEMVDGFISRKSEPSVRWVWETNEHCLFCNFLVECSKFRTVIYDPPELDATLQPRWLRREKTKWFEFKDKEVILRLVFDTPSTEDSWLGHSDSSTSLPHSLIGCTASEEGHLIESRSGSIRVILPFINSFDSLRKNIKSCQEGHSCMQEAGSTAPPLSIPNLLLVDCVWRQVVTAPDRCWYLALSYVWGNQKPRSVNTGERLSALPQTIEDSIAVTLKLGFQYLWIDMYCIKQDNGYDVSNQIRHMDLVYRRAQATIIVAKGNDPSCGLPGVSSARQTCQTQAMINGVSLANFTYNPWELVDSSAWNTRAWTFQESLFSPRRIFLRQSK